MKDEIGGQPPTLATVVAIVIILAACTLVAYIERTPHPDPEVCSQTSESPSDCMRWPSH